MADARTATFPWDIRPMENQSDIRTDPPTPDAAAPLLLVSRDPIKIEALETVLREQALEIRTVPDMPQDLPDVGRTPFAVIILDLDPPGGDGMRRAREIRECPATRATPLLLISASKPAEKDLRRIFDLGIADFLHLPGHGPALDARIRMLASVYRELFCLRAQADSVRRENRDLRETVETDAARIRRLEEEYTLIFGNLYDYAIFSVDPAGRITSWNTGAERLLGYAEKQILGHDVKILFTAEDIVSGESELEIRLARETGKAEDERWHVRCDGSRFWASGILARMLDKGGNLRGYVKIMRDQTEREIARRKLEEGEERNRRLIEEIQDYAIIMLDPDGAILTWNKGFEAMFGYAAHEIIGRNVDVIYSREDRETDKPARELRDAAGNGRSKDTGLRVRKDGTIFWSEETITPLRNGEGILTGFSKIIRDISQSMRIEEERAAHVRFLEGMDALSEVLERNLDMEKVLQLAVEKIVSLFGASEAFLFHPIASDADRLPIRYSARDGQVEGGPFPAEIDPAALMPGFEEALLDAAEPLIIEGDRLLPDRASGETRRMGAAAAIAIRPKSGPPWALTVIHGPSRRTWPETDIRLLKDIAHRIGAVLDNLILFRNLRASEERFRWLVEKTTEIIWRMEMRHPVPVSLPPEEQVDRFYREAFLVECNDAMARRYGLSAASELLGSSLDRLLPKGVSANRAFLLDFIRSGYRTLESEYSEQDKDGRTRYLVSSLVGMLEEGALTGAWGTVRDITEKRSAEVELRRSRDQLDVILQGIADAIFVYSPAGSLVYCNEAAARMMDFPARAGRRDADALMEESLARMDIRDEAGNPLPRVNTPVGQALQGRDTPPALLRFRMGAQGPERWLITRARPIFDDAGKVRMVISIAQDTTELRQAEDQFRQAQKMEAVGRLAGGIAHDFNNLLTAINGYADLLTELTEPGDARKTYLEEIRKAGERAASLTNQLLVYSRRQILAPKAVDLNQVVSRMEMMLRRLIGEDIDLEVRLKPGIDSIKADQGQIEQVILNLAVNARDAMPGGGRLRLETDQVGMSGESACLNEAAISGQYVRLSVRDTGVGMDETVRSHLFEPFFTTKKPGMGTGLGLSTVYGIVRQFGGCIGVDSEKGKGTLFRIYFPATAAIVRETRPAEADAGEARLSGTETILVAEDDFAVRGLVRDILVSRGYKVLEAGNGMEALETVNEHAGRIDLLLTDVVMAQMGGRELADRMKRDRSDLKVIYMSGYTDDAVVRHGVFTKSEAFLHKPFTAESLLSRIRLALDSVPA